jgi:hypothetical protein
MLEIETQCVSSVVSVRDAQSHSWAKENLMSFPRLNRVHARDVHATARDVLPTYAMYVASSQRLDRSYFRMIGPNQSLVRPLQGAEEGFLPPPQRSSDIPSVPGLNLVALPFGQAGLKIQVLVVGIPPPSPRINSVRGQY